MRRGEAGVTGWRLRPVVGVGENEERSDEL